jgi:hypothetical protein
MLGTNTVEIYKCFDSSIGTFYLVDTPGFDDTQRPDTDILRELATWLNKAYRHNIMLTGIIFLHKISNTGMSVRAIRNLVMFRKLLGKSSLSKVVLATTCWDLVDPDIGMAREDFIKTTKWYWGGMINSGSHVFRQDEDRTSARAIIKYLVQKRTMADTSLIPVNKGKSLSKAHADPGSNAHLSLVRGKWYQDEMRPSAYEGGQATSAQLADMKAQYDQKLADLVSNFKDELVRNDATWEARCEEERRSSKAENDRYREDIQTLQAEVEDLQQRLENTSMSVDRESDGQKLMIQGK